MANKWVENYEVYEVFGTRLERDGTVSGAIPSAEVQVAVHKYDAPEAKRAFLGGWNTSIPGKPAIWPYTGVHELYCVGCQQTNVNMAFSVNQEELLETDYVFFNLSYTAKLGRYMLGGGGITYYIEDSLEPRYETRPLQHSLYCWSTIETGETAKRVLTSNEAPVKSNSGFTLLHTVSGYFTLPTDLEQLLGTTAHGNYTSPNLNKNFDPSSTSGYDGVLLLRTVNVVQEFTANSYLGDQPTYTLKCRYEYKKEGWNQFWRSSRVSPGGFYDRIQFQNLGVDEVFFESADHSDLLTP